MGHHGADLAFARGENFVGQRCHRKFTAELRHLPDPAAKTGKAAGFASQAGNAHHIQRRAGKHQSAGAIHIAGDNIHCVNQPGAETAMLGSGGAHPTVGGGTVRRSKITSDLPYGVRRDTGMLRRALRRPRLDQSLQQLQSVDHAGKMGGVGQAFGEQHMQQTEQQEHISTGADKVMRISNFCCFCAPGIQHDNAAATSPNCLESIAHVRGRHDASIGRHRVGTDHQKIAGTVNIRDRKQQLMPEHFQTGQHMRQLIH